MGILLDEGKIQTRLKFIASMISRKYDKVTMLIVLSGGVYTGIDLSKYITVPCKLEFVKVSSYGNNEESAIVELKWMSANKNTHLGNLLIVDDVCDTGKSMDYLLKYIRANYTFDSLSVMTLLDKPSRREKEVKLDYRGFEIDNLFVYGYGLDLSGYDRNKTYIAYKE